MTRSPQTLDEIMSAYRRGVPFDERGRIFEYTVSFETSGRLEVRVGFEDGTTVDYAFPVHLTEDERAGAVLLMLLPAVRGECALADVLAHKRPEVIAALRQAIGRLTGTTPAEMPSDHLPWKGANDDAATPRA